MYQRILVPIDGSATAERGLDEAIELAKLCRSSLVLLSVTEVYPVMMEMATATTWEQITGDLRAQGQRVLDQARERVIAQGIACEAHLEDAAAARVCDVIVDQARDRACNLIVMGTHGRRGVSHALIGSDAERVLRMAPVPVLLLRSDEKA
jgi:nucleotide-binding universal stress UspA family protein